MYILVKKRGNTEYLYKEVSWRDKEGKIKKKREYIGKLPKSYGLRTRQMKIKVLIEELERGKERLERLGRKSSEEYCMLDAMISVLRENRREIKR